MPSWNNSLLRRRLQDVVSRDDVPRCPSSPGLHREDGNPSRFGERCAVKSCCNRLLGGDIYLHAKFDASSVLPLPFHCATCG